MKLWRLILRLYPDSFRRSYGDELLDAMQRSQERYAAGLRPQRFFQFWRSTFDLLRGAMAERRYAARPPGGPQRERSKRLAELPHLLRLGARRLARDPAFAAPAVLVLALGVGANGAMFAVLDRVLLQPLPFAEPGELVRVWESHPERGWDLYPVSSPNYLDLRDRNRSLRRLAAYAPTTFNLTAAEEPVQLDAARITYDFFDVLGLPAEVGRTFQEGDLRAPDVVLVTEGAWRSRFGGRASLVGENLVLDGRAHRVVGVVPSSSQWIDQWDVLGILDPSRNTHRDDRRLSLVGRLAEGTTPRQAEADLDRIARELAESHPASNQGFDTRVAPLKAALVGDEARSSIVLLTLASGFVLILAASNLAHLLLTRSVSRQADLSVGIALGATRLHLVGQQVVEAMWLGLAAAASGLGLTFVGLWAFRRWAPAGMPRVDEIEMGAGVVVLTVLASVAASVLASAVPAWSASRGPWRAQVSSARATASREKSRSRGALLATEVAASLVLLVGAVLLIRSLESLRRVDPGLTTDGVLTAKVSLLPERGVDWGDTEARDEALRRRASLLRTMLDELRASPAVDGAAFISGLPFGGGATSWSMRIEGQSHPPGQAPEAFWRVASPGYFDTLDIPLLEGRPFDTRDDWQAGGTVIVSRRMAETLWPGESAVGKRFYPWERADDPVEVVGVVGDVRERALDLESAHLVYLPQDQYLFWSQLYLVVRGRGDLAPTIPALRSVWRRLAPDVPLASFRPLSEVLDETMATRRFGTALLLAFATLAVTLAITGIYGVTSAYVVRRIPELGIRRALGATSTRLVFLIAAQSMRFVVAGLAVGAPAALALAPLLESVLVEVAPRDPWSVAGAAGLIAAIALAATLVPAVQGSRASATRAMRAE